MDTQVIELLGRHRLTDELLRAELEVAIPARDRGIDLIAYAELGSKVTKFIARPIQMKAASTMSFGINRKYEKFPDLLIAFVWHLDSAEKAITFCLSYAEAIAAATEMGYTNSPSWKVGGRYDNTRPGAELRKLMDPYRMTPEKWWKRVVEAPYVAQPRDSAPPAAR